MVISIILMIMDWFSSFPDKYYFDLLRRIWDEAKFAA